MTSKPFSILFVCTGNICRSPTAEAVFRHRIREAGLHEKYRHDSAGTEDYHTGEAPDHRSSAELLKHGIDMRDLKARKVKPSDFYEFDLILAMDRTHYNVLKRQAPKDATAEIAPYLDYAHGAPGDVPDPYYGGPKDFAAVVALAHDATQALLARFLQGK